MAVRKVRFHTLERILNHYQELFLTTMKEIDLIATQLTTTYARSKVIDFTTSFSKDPMSAIIPAPKESDFMSAIVKPFQPGVMLQTKLILLHAYDNSSFVIKVWGLIMFSMFSATSVTFIFMKLIHKYMPEYYDVGISNLQFWENFMYYFGIISSQGKHVFYIDDVVLT